MAKFFIDRPVFAWVIAIVIMMVGALSISQLSVSQYPEISPPSVSINASYPGASASTVEEGVTQVIEQGMTGLDHLMYMTSQSSSSGSVAITLTFESGTDADIAQVQVKNKLEQVTSQLPDAVQDQGITVAKSNSNILMVLSLISSDGSMSHLELADYMVSNFKDALSRTEGVGTIQVFGSQYAMRIWLDPNKLNSFQLTPSDVSYAVASQNSTVNVGSLGGAPSVAGQQVNATMMAQTMLSTPEEFGRIIIRVNADGSQVRLADIARIEIGGENYQGLPTYNGVPAGGMAIALATGANALDTAEAVRAKVASLEPFLPEGVMVNYPYDTTDFIEISISEVVNTLFEAIGLVFLVMLLFLQNIRATLIPTLAVPVVLLGTFGVMSAFGFSINTLTMFGLVLAIGLLVDDAIVVVENVERIMETEGLSPRDATRKSMEQITSALVGVALVLSAVFVPMAFMGGSTGEIYRQFSLTIVSAMVLSVIVALVLTPALCASMLKPHSLDKHNKKGGFFGWFNRFFSRITNGYSGSVAYMIKRSGRFLVVYLLLFVGMGYLFVSLPSSFLPEEDQGVFLAMVQLPTGATQERTQQVLNKVQAYYEENEQENVASFFSVAGFSLAGSGQNMGMAFMKLKNWDERQRPDQTVNAIIGRSMGAFSQIKEAQIFAFNLPAIMGLGTSTGFDFYLKDLGNLGHDKLVQARNQLLGMAAQNPGLTRVRPNGMEDTPQYKLDIDYEKAMALGISVTDINNTLSTAWGSLYVNDFVNNGRIKRVYLQANAEFRMQPEDIRLWYVPNNKGEMVPFSTFTSGHWEMGSPRLERFNGSPGLEIVGEAAPGTSSGDAMVIIDQLVSQLPDGIGYEWTGFSYQEQMSGSQTHTLYALSFLTVFLCLAALYESWSVPFSVMLAVPLGIIGALAAASLRGLENDIYFQVGLLTTMGLSAKNAILIVEFAKSHYDQGMPLYDATIEACLLRLRPIIMTSLAFMLGVLPLAISTGAGANSRHAIGTGVLGGMFSATVLAIFFIPLFFVVVMKLFRTKPTQGAVEMEVVESLEVKV